MTCIFQDLLYRFIKYLCSSLCDTTVTWSYKNCEEECESTQNLLHFQFAKIIISNRFIVIYISQKQKKERESNFCLAYNWLFEINVGKESYKQLLGRATKTIHQASVSVVMKDDQGFSPLQLCIMKQNINRNLTREKDSQIIIDRSHSLQSFFRPCLL